MGKRIAAILTGIGMLVSLSANAPSAEPTWQPTTVQTPQSHTSSGDGGQLPYARVRVAIPTVSSQQTQPANPYGTTDSSSSASAASSPYVSTPSSSPYQAQTTSTSGYGSYGSDSSSYYSQPTVQESKPDEPLALATLNGRTITDLDVMRELWARRGRETLEWMIGRDILTQELARLGLDVLDGEVDARLEKHLEGLRKAFPNLTNPDDLTRAASGMRVDEYRERSVWVELALRKIMRVTLKPTDEQLRAYFAEKQGDFIQPETVRISQVFIAPQTGQDNDRAPGRSDWALAERQINEAHGRLRMSEDFAAVARAYGSGGQLSRWVRRGELLRELEEAAFSIRPGSVSQPIKSAMGYHIVLVEDKRERKLPKFDEVRGEVQEMYEEKLFLLRAGEFMTRLREKALKSGGLVVMDKPDLFPDPKKE